MRVADSGRPARDNDVAEQGQGRPESNRIAVQAADDGLVAVEQPKDDRASGLALSGEAPCPRSHAFQVAAGTESAARPGQHDGADIGIVLQLGEDAHDLGPQRARERIQCVRPVQRDKADGAVAFGEDDGLGHGVPPDGFSPTGLGPPARPAKPYAGEPPPVPFFAASR